MEQHLELIGTVKAALKQLFAATFHPPTKPKLLTHTAVANAPKYSVDSHYACRGGALNNWLRKRPDAQWKRFIRGQQREGQLKRVDKDGEEIGATILHSRLTPTEIR